jgi:hypothetical protein
MKPITTGEQIGQLDDETEGNTNLRHRSKKNCEENRMIPLIHLCALVG